MNEVLLDAFRHSAWANRELIAFCRRLTPEQLRTATSGSYGSILATLQHMVGAESYYRLLFAGAFLDWDWNDDVLPTLDQLDGWSGELAAYWEELLSGDVDAAAVPRHISADGSRREEPTSIVLVQALHHANVHREQVNMILTSLGVEPPDLDVWVWDLATGRRKGPPS